MTTYAFGPFELRTATFELLRAGTPIHIERRAFDLLAYLIEHRDRVVSSEELLSELWRGAKVTRSSPVRAIAMLRDALEDQATNSRLIATVHGRGYRFVGVVEELAAGPDSTPALEHSADATADAFVGRGAEIHLLGALLDAARAGRGGVFLLGGEPGMGKTRLARELQRRAFARGFLVHTAWCHDGEGAPAYWPWIQMLRAHASATRPSELRDDLGPRGGLVVRTVPELAALLPDLEASHGLSAEEARFHFFDGVTRLFVHAARRRPLLLFFDDLHSIDAPSLRLLEFMAREIPDVPLLLIGAHRIAAVDLAESVRGVLAQIGRHAHCVRRELTGLSQGEVGWFVASAGLENRIDSAQVAQIHGRTGGNPLFVRELLRSAALGTEDLRFAVPTEIRDLLAGRIALLASSTRRLLDTAAIVGTEWSADLVAAICDIEDATFSQSVDDAIASSLIRPVTGDARRFTFVHALFRETLYSALFSGTRQSMHRRAAEWLQQHPSGIDPGEVAYHAYHSATLDDGQMAIAWSIRAADRCTRRLAYEDTATHCTRALELLAHSSCDDGSEVRCELLVTLGEARMRIGDRTGATDVLWQAARLARRLKSGALLGRIALGLSPRLVALEIKAESDDLVALLREALELCEGDAPLRAQLIARLAIALMFRAPRTEIEALADAALDLARASKDTYAEAFAGIARYVVRWCPGNLSERIQVGPKLLVWATQAEDRELEVIARICRFSSFLESGDLRSAELEVKQLDRMGEELRQPQALWHRIQMRACLAHMRGEFDEMLRLCAEFCRVAEKVQDLNAVHARTVYEVLHAWETRRFDEAIEKVEPLRSTYSGWDSAMVYSLSLARRHHETRILLDDLCNSRKMREPWDLNWLCLMIDRADACAQIGDLEVARALYRELLPHRSQISIVGYGFGFWGSVERVLGVLAAMDRRWTAAEEHFQAALGTHRRLGARALAARTQWGYARMLRERNSPGDHERAKQMIGEAMRDARALGMTTLIDQLESLSAELPEH